MKIEILFSDFLEDESCSFGSLFESSRKSPAMGVTNDSRKVKPGFVYVAIRGSRLNGEEFIEDARRRGATVVVGSKDADSSDVRVTDPRLALAELSCKFYGHPGNLLHMTGITGTNGKTTVAYLVNSVFAAVGKKPGLMTTVEYRIGERVIPAVRTTMDAPDLQAMLSDMLKAGCESAVMEVSSHAIDQHRAAFVEFDVAVFTNLTRDHLDYHHTIDEYFSTKKQLFLDLGHGKKTAVAVLNTDDPMGQALFECDEVIAEKISFGINSLAAVRAEDLVLSADGTSFTIDTPWGRGRMISGLLGRYNVSNLLAAAAVCGAAGIAIDDIVRVLSRVDRVPGRLEEICVKSEGYQVFVDYAHTDDALEKVISTLQEITTNRVIVVFGCGGDRDRTKRSAMGKVAASLANYSIITSDNPRTEDASSIIREIEEGFQKSSDYEIIEDRREAIRKGLEMARPGDVILVAGKGHEGFQEMLNRTVPFDDRIVIREEIESLASVRE